MINDRRSSEIGQGIKRERSAADGKDEAVRQVKYVVVRRARQRKNRNEKFF